MKATITSKSHIENVPVPACTVGEDGRVICANDLMTEVFPYKDIEGANFFTLTGWKAGEIYEHVSDGERLVIDRNEKFFSMTTSTNEEYNGEPITIYFNDVTEAENLRKKVEDEKPAIIMVEIDNYDELMASDTSENRKAIPAEVDSILRRWFAEYGTALTGVDDEDYIGMTTCGNVRSMFEESFQVLDLVRNIETRIDFPVSVSIGVGMSDISIIESKELAKASLELALGRGGDQAVVKTDDRTKFYGGTRQSMEKNNRGKSRVIAHALSRLIQDSRKVIIAGHKWPDMDSFGAAIGAYKICEYLGKEAYIVVEDYNDALQVIYDHAVETEDYNIIKNKKAMEIADRDTLMFIVDNNRPTLVECPELLDVCKRKVVIDHHRTTDTAIEGATIAYIESYASSSSELIAEIMQYVAPKRFINKFESEALLAGIMVDTNSFSVRSGVRTFEAAAWLKRAGADTAEVKRFFQTEITAFQAQAEAVASAEYAEYGVAYAITEGYSAEANIIIAKVADQLLTVKGIKASFVICRNDSQITLVSARSLGEVNVQTIMERFGGGGHLTTAAAQIADMSPEEVLEKLKGIVRPLFENDEEEENSEEE